MKKLMFILAFIGLLGGIASAQYYKTGIGGRIGWAYGFTVKHFITERLAFEGIASTRYYGNGFIHSGKGGFDSNLGLNITALLEYHFPIGKVDGFNWFIGGGLHIGSWRGGNHHHVDNNWYFLLGLDAIGGVEYTFKKIPLTLQADIKPTFNVAFGGRVYGGYDEIAISARYIFR